MTATQQQDMGVVQKEIDQTNRAFVEAMNRGDVDGATERSWCRRAIDPRPVLHARDKSPRVQQHAIAPTA